MATYKVIQDVEAEDKLVGPLTLRQFIYAGIAAFCIYLSFFSITKGVAFLMLFFVPVALLTGFLAVPWGGDQPTEVWALAKLRFFLKPRKRIWDQSGAKELVTITVPKRVERVLTNNLSKYEIHSRLHALADTIDSRGWAVKNANVNVAAVNRPTYTASDRLVDASTIIPQEVATIDVRASDDMLDASANPVAQHLTTMMSDAAVQQRKRLVRQMNDPSPALPVIPGAAPGHTMAAVPTYPVATTGSTTGQPQQDLWFMQPPTPLPAAPHPQPTQTMFAETPYVAPGTAPSSTPTLLPQAAAPDQTELAMVDKFRQENSSQTIATSRLKLVKTPQQLNEEERLAAEEAAVVAAITAQQAAEQAAERDRQEQQAAQKAQVTSHKQAAIINLANSDDFDVATLARRAKEETGPADGEVVISLH